MLINGAGSIVSLFVTIMIASTKFMHGAWVIIVVVPVMVALLVRLNRQYESELHELAHDAPRAAEAPVLRRHVVLVLVDALDVAAWRSLGDGRTSKVVVLGQCAIGHDWRTKLDDLSADLWRAHVSWATAPIKSMAIPVVHPAGIDWERNVRRAGIIFDRLRLIALLGQGAGLPGVLSDAIREWCTARIDVLPKA